MQAVKYFGQFGNYIGGQHPAVSAGIRDQLFSYRLWAISKVLSTGSLYFLLFGLQFGQVKSSGGCSFLALVSTFLTTAECPCGLAIIF